MFWVSLFPFSPFLLERETAFFPHSLPKLLFHSQSRVKLSLSVDLTSVIISFLKTTSRQFIHTNYSTINSFIFLSLTFITRLKNEVLTIFRLLMSNTTQTNQYFPSTLSHALNHRSHLKVEDVFHLTLMLNHDRWFQFVYWNSFGLYHYKGQLYCSENNF